MKYLKPIFFEFTGVDLGFIGDHPVWEFSRFFISSFNEVIILKLPYQFYKGWYLKKWTQNYIKTVLGHD